MSTIDTRDGYDSEASTELSEADLAQVIGGCGNPERDSDCGGGNSGGSAG